MGKEFFYTRGGRKIQVEVLGREFGSNGHGPEERIYLAGSHPELPDSELHEGLTGEETVIIRPLGAFTMDGQLT